MQSHVMVGFGMGPIQAGLFAAEAFKSGRFSRIVISEVDPKLVEAIRANGGRYAVNVASSSGIAAEQVEGIEIYNSSVESDRQQLLEALSQATEIVTSLPSVNFYDTGQNSVASLIARGLEHSTAKGTIIYTAENNNHAAEILEEAVKGYRRSLPPTVQFLNTVIGKMSQVVVSEAEIAEKNLKPIAPGFGRAFLVEEFNRILVTKSRLPGFTPGIRVFIEKEDLLPFEEAKLYGHNAIHALLAYLGARKGYQKMARLKEDKAVMQIARDAFIKESGAALIKKYAHLNEELFTEAGFQAYAEDLLRRMTNPYLDDSVERAARDPQRKLSKNDRLFGAIRLVLSQGITPLNLTRGALAGLEYYKGRPITADEVEPLLAELWQSDDGGAKPSCAPRQDSDTPDPVQPSAHPACKTHTPVSRSHIAALIARNLTTEASATSVNT
jgi:mannitol-1-phosphate 5-dehydrogenase